MKFEEYRIAEDIKQNLARLGFVKPTDIQFKAIGAILKGEDVLAIAQTGTGKTAAFVIPVLNQLIAQRKKQRNEGIRCIVMAPTRELVLQITEVFKEIGQKIKVNTTAVIGGVEQDPQIANLEEGTEVLVATPGRLFDLVSQGHIKLNRIQILVLDEADHMLDLGFYKDIQNLLRFLPQNRQTLFFSATINPKIKKLAYSLVNNPIRIQVSPKDPVAKNVEHAVCFVDMDDKRFFLERYINNHADDKILVFVRTKVRAERLFKAMERVDIDTETIHGDKSQNERIKTLDRFKSGKIKVLITTDVSARGIDIPEVQHVINYDLPDEKPESYVHRIGRTGRGKAKGKAISFCSPEEKEMLKSIEAFITKPIQVLQIGKKDYEAIAKPEEESAVDLQSLMDQIEAIESKKSKKKKGKK